jgi:sugar lactone lactonase YvrE
MLCICVFRLIKYDSKLKKNTVLMKNLHFANGIELSDDESFILVAETLKFRVHKYDKIF